MAEQIKIFSGNDREDIEKEVNHWLLGMNATKELLQLNSHVEMIDNKSGFNYETRYTIICLYEDGI